MTQSSDFKIPYNSLVNYVPQYLRNSVGTSLFENLFDRFMTHDESIPLYGYVGRKPTNPDDHAVRVPQATVERDINSVVPVLNFKLGSERYSYTVEDLINKADALGVNTNSQQWLYSQGNNYLPPIDLDKFANFFSYYWVAGALPSVRDMAWNKELEPEYYTIARPSPTDLNKLNVVAASNSPRVLTGSGFNKLSFEVLFTSPTEYKVSVVGSLGGYTPLPSSVATHTLSAVPTAGNATDHVVFTVTGVAAGTTTTLLEFDIVRDAIYTDQGVQVGVTGFETGDKFTIQPEFITRNYTISFSGGVGVKGKINKIKPLSTYQTMDGVQLKAGDRVLVKNQNSAVDNGIYVVSAGAWSRAADDTSTIGNVVFVTSGTVNKQSLFTLSTGQNGNVQWTLTGSPGTAQSNTSDWQEGNYWVHVDDLQALGLSRGSGTQALRPIIEYKADLQLNSFVKNGLPSDSGNAYIQSKTEFNQLPLFDLFRYDGTHSGLVSPVFYYDEDLTADLDTKLQKRIALSNNDSADYMFNHGMVDNDGQLLFVKRAGALKTIWHAGYTEATIVDTTFNGDGNGTLVGLEAIDFTQQQVWTLTATSSTTFALSASKMPTLLVNKTATVGSLYNNGDIKFTIQQGSVPFSIGDTFTIRVGSLETPRYVYRDGDDNIYDRQGGYAADLNKVGAWQVPRTFYNNPYNESRSAIAEGVLYSHFLSILSNQVEGQPVNYAFGGSIKLWSEQQTLLASLLMQRDLTPVSMIDMAQRQYETGLSNVRNLFQTNIAQYISDNGPVRTYVELQNLFKYIQDIRAHDDDVRTVLYDSTSPVLGFPATLPQLGVMPLVQPTIEFDAVMGRVVMVHHDGHKSVPFVDGEDMLASVLGSYGTAEVTRSDGTKTLAVARTKPTVPYKGELYMLADGSIQAFDVTFDTVSVPTSAAVGDVWYQRSNDALLVYGNSGWEAATFTKDSLWVPISFADTLNSLVLLVENTLFAGINPNARKYDFSAAMQDVGFMEQLKEELFRYAAANGLDPLGSDYNAGNAFTWNYSGLTSADLPVMPAGAVPARWYNVLMAHQSAVPGVIPTSRPHLEPWKLMGYQTQAAWVAADPMVSSMFSSINESMIDSSYTNLGAIAAVSVEETFTLLAGLPLIDGYQTKSGDKILLANPMAGNNTGVWIVNNTGWTQVSTTVKNIVTIANGKRKGSAWVQTGPTAFKQVRQWSDDMWAYIKNARPALRVSVDTYTDTLLPPFVSTAHPSVGDGLTTTWPLSASKPYQFGQGSPVETVWSYSTDYGYSLARALFRFDPLAFLGFCWGFNWVEADGILYDGIDLNMPGHKRFRLHGETISTVSRSVMGVNGVGTMSVTYDGYDVHSLNGSTVRAQNFTVRSNGDVLGYAVVGSPATFNGVSFTLKDEGKPFRIGDRYEISNGVATFVSATTNIILGFGQTFTNALREISIDTTSSYAIAAFREWDVNMGYRAGGLVGTDDLQVYTDSETLSSAAYDLLYKKNQIAKDEWIQALRVTVTQFGKTVKKEVGYAPQANGDDWVFRVEGYNPRYTAITYYQMALGDNPMDFKALSGAHTDLAWYQPSTITGVVNTNLPLTITGVQNLVTFLFGYSLYLESRGWEFNKYDGQSNVDAETGRIRNFQLEIEKLVDRCYAGISLNQGHVVNPFIDRVWFNQDKGLLAEFIDTPLFDISGHPGAFDALGVKFRKDDIDVARTNEQSSFGAVAPMFSAHVQVDEYEHLFIFNNYSQPSTNSGQLYDPFSGARVVTYKFNGRKQATTTMRPEFGGHYLVNNEVRQNMQASTDNIANIYDANKVFENEITSRHAMALLGFNTKQYFDDLDISEKSQFNFWRGLIQAKGTNLSIDAYLNNNRFDDAKVDEYWAYKLATYGDARQRSFPELKLYATDALTQFTKFQFDPATKLDGYTSIDQFDETRWFSIDDMPSEPVRFAADKIGTFKINASNGTVYQLPFVADALTVTGSFEKVNATSIKAMQDGHLTVVGYGPARPKFNPIKLFNYAAGELIEEIPVWHPAAGQHTPVAMEGVNVVSNINPARYNYSNQVNNGTYDPLRPWGYNEVGRTWFDTRNLEYVPYYDSMIFGEQERLSRWGSLADFATVDVYEWVKSTVPPSEYDALAIEQAGDADLNDADKAAGQVADKQTYTRTRSWAMRPVAWSYSKIPLDDDVYGVRSKVFAGGVTQDVNITQIGDNKYAVLQQGTWKESVGLEAGWRFGAWINSTTNPRPASEYVIENNFTKLIENSQQSTSQFTVKVVAAGTSDKSGQLLVEALPVVVASNVDQSAVVVDASIRITEVDSGDYEDVLITSATGLDFTPGAYLNGAVVNMGPGQSATFTSVGFGISIIVTANVLAMTAFPADAIAAAIAEALGANVYVKDAVQISDVVPSSDTTLLAAPVTDDDLAYQEDHAIRGWRVWQVPSQGDLDSDSKSPVVSWKPFYGDYVDMQSTDITQIQAAIAYVADPLVMNDGSTVVRYKTTWSAWSVLSNVVMVYPAPVGAAYTAVRVNDSVVFGKDTNFDATYTSVYVNGISQLKAAYDISAKSLTVSNIGAASKVTVIVRKYEPSKVELAFDPDVADDLSYQKQFKEDYEYVSLPVRDNEGALSSTVYFFWVKNKTTVATGKKLSVQTIAQQLREGPATYLTFQNISDSAPYTYDAIAISGLSYEVTKDDAFKLRFTRNFTLRDDPQELDLKNVHTEWALIRPGQKTKVPENLWRKLTDSVVGADAAGNAIPSLRRVLYDERNGTFTSYGFGVEQTLAPVDLLRSSIVDTIVNTKLVSEGVGITVPDYISFLDMDQSDTWFATEASARKTMTDIWNNATVAQVNEIFFGALNDILAANYELSDIFKTSRLSAYSIKVISAAPVAPTYE